MVNGTLVQALDWRKKKGEVHGQYSYLDGDRWFVVKYGPGYHNLFRVTGHDDVGLEMLRSIERKGVSDAKD